MGADPNVLVDANLKLKGSLCALVTPFTPEGAVDFPAFEALLDWHLQSGTHGLVVAGSTGESASLDESEWQRLLEVAVARVAGRIPVIAGCGAAATHKALHLVKQAKTAGATAALVVTPYYVRPTQEGLFRHYSTLAREGGLPLVLYNVPTRTSCDLLPATVARLLDHNHVIGIKEAVPDPARMQEWIALKREGFCVLSGDDATCARAVSTGADGVISVVANVCPAAFSALLEDLSGGRTTEAEERNAQLAPVYHALGLEPNPIPVKWMLHRLGRIRPVCRLPLHELSENLRPEVERCADLAKSLDDHCGSRKSSVRAA